ncbi:hypothetical protein CI238_11402, partial [Colletotrichum incanum]
LSCTPTPTARTSLPTPRMFASPTSSLTLAVAWTVTKRRHNSHSASSAVALTISAPTRCRSGAIPQSPSFLLGEYDLEVTAKARKLKKSNRQTRQWIEDGLLYFCLPYDHTASRIQKDLMTERPHQESFSQ